MTLEQSVRLLQAADDLKAWIRDERLIIKVGGGDKLRRLSTPEDCEIALVENRKLWLWPVSPWTLRSEYHSYRIGDRWGFYLYWSGSNREVYAFFHSGQATWPEHSLHSLEELLIKI